MKLNGQILKRSQFKLISTTGGTDSDLELIESENSAESDYITGVVNKWHDLENYITLKF